MKTTVLGTMLDLVNGNLPDVVVPSDIKMDATRFRSLGVLPDVVRPLSFVYQQNAIAEEAATQDLSSSFLEMLQSEEGLESLLRKVQRVSAIATREEALKILLWEGAVLGIPNLFDYGDLFFITDDWHIVVPRLKPEPRFVLFKQRSLPSSFFRILLKVLKGGIHWDGEPYLPSIRGPVKIIGRLEASYARQLYIFRLCLSKLEQVTQRDFVKGRTEEQIYEEVTVAEARRYVRKMSRLERQQNIIHLMLAEHVKDIVSNADFSQGVLVFRDWDLAVPI